MTLSYKQLNDKNLGMSLKLDSLVKEYNKVITGGGSTKSLSTLLPLLKKYKEESYSKGEEIPVDKIEYDLNKIVIQSIMKTKSLACKLNRYLFQHFNCIIDGKYLYTNDERYNIDEFTKTVNINHINIIKDEEWYVEINFPLINTDYNIYLKYKVKRVGGNSHITSFKVYIGSSQSKTIVYSISTSKYISDFFDRLDLDIYDLDNDKYAIYSNQSLTIVSSHSIDINLDLSNTHEKAIVYNNGQVYLVDWKKGKLYLTDYNTGSLTLNDTPSDSGVFISKMVYDTCLWYLDSNIGEYIMVDIFGNTCDIVNVPPDSSNNSYSSIGRMLVYPTTNSPSYLDTHHLEIYDYYNPKRKYDSINLIDEYNGQINGSIGIKNNILYTKNFIGHLIGSKIRLKE